MDCPICRKHAGQAGRVAQPVGGYFYEDDHWAVCHAPVPESVPGQLYVESRRHYLDFAGMTGEEAASYGLLLKKLYAALKELTGAERVYSVVLLEGVPHFHSHLVPRVHGTARRGLGFLAEGHSCTEAEALAAVEGLRGLLAGR